MIHYSVKKQILLNLRLISTKLKAFQQVADFGLAKLVGRTNEDELLATRLVGTPGYLPPE